MAALVIFALVAAAAVAVALLAVAAGTDSRPGIGDDYRRGIAN